MILIRKIDIIDVPRDHYPIQNYENFKEIPFHPDNRLVDPNIRITFEMVRGITYCTLDGREICVGMSKQVQEAIGLPYEALEGMREKIIKLESENVHYCNKLRRAENCVFKYEYMFDCIRHLTLWKRLKFLLTGEINMDLQIGQIFVKRNDPKHTVVIKRLQSPRPRPLNSLITVEHSNKQLQLIGIDMFRKEYQRQWKAPKESKDQKDAPKKVEKKSKK